MKIVKQRAALYMFVTNGRVCVAKNVRSFVYSFVCLFVRLFVCSFVLSSDDDDECEQTKAFQPKQSDITVEVKLFKVIMTIQNHAY